MNDATRAMNVLLLSELPDPGLDLSPQQLHAFSLFAKLPLEVRLMIVSNFCVQSQLPPCMRTDTDLT